MNILVHLQRNVLVINLYESCITQMDFNYWYITDGSDHFVNSLCKTHIAFSPPYNKFMLFNSRGLADLSIFYG